MKGIALGIIPFFENALDTYQLVYGSLKHQSRERTTSGLLALLGSMRCAYNLFEYEQANFFLKELEANKALIISNLGENHSMLADMETLRAEIDGYKLDN